MTKGFEIFFHLIKDNLKTKQDLIVSIVHFFLINQDYKCIGLGTNFTENDQNLTGSELLPKDWNKENDESFCMKYIQKKENVVHKLVFRFDKINQNWFLNFSLDSGQKNVEKEFNVDHYVTNDIKNFEKAFFNESSLENFLKLLKQEMDENLSTKKPTPAERTVERAEGGTSGFEPSSPTPCFNRPNRSPPDGAARVYPPVVGGSDVNPFGGLGGGMIFDPRDPSHFPYQNNPNNFRGGYGPPRLGGPVIGMVPPGARFDPFGPPGAEPDRQRPTRPRPLPGPGAPDPDHLPPPGYDDMFM